MDILSYRIFLRLFVEARDCAEAQPIADSVIAKAQAFGDVRQHEIERYWKIPEYYEVSLEIYPREQAADAFTHIMASLASGWECHGQGNEIWAVWSSSPENKFVSTNVRWANLELTQLRA